MPHPTPLSSGVAVPADAPVVTAVRAQDLGVRLGGTPILRGLELHLRAGEALAITGPNGSGKSTLLRVLATLLRPSTGSLEVLGHDCAGPVRPALRRDISLVGHEPALHPELTVSENLSLVAELAGVERDAVDAALLEVGLAGAADRPIRVCSEGMKRRTELARVLVCGPRLLLLDEAHAALDVQARHLVAAVTRRVTLGGGAAVLVTHDPGGLDGVATRQATLHGGRLLEGAAR